MLNPPGLSGEPKYPLGREIFSTNLEMTLHYLYPSYDYMAKIMTIR